MTDLGFPDAVVGEADVDLSGVLVVALIGLEHDLGNWNSVVLRRRCDSLFSRTTTSSFEELTSISHPPSSSSSALLVARCRSNGSFQNHIQKVLMTFHFEMHRDLQFSPAIHHQHVVVKAVDLQSVANVVFRMQGAPARMRLERQGLRIRFYYKLRPVHR
jgi:hypothetical protein